MCLVDTSSKLTEFGHKTRSIFEAWNRSSRQRDRCSISHAAAQHPQPCQHSEFRRVTILSIPFGPRLVLMASATAAERGDRDRCASRPGAPQPPPAPRGAPPRPPHPCRRRCCCCGSGRVCRGPGTRPWPGSHCPGRGRGPWAPRSPAWRPGTERQRGARGDAGERG